MEQIASVVCAVHEFAESNELDQLSNRAVVSMLSPIRQRYDSVTIDVISEQEPASRAFHHNFLIHNATHSASFSLCRIGAIPWPLRGAQRWDSQVVVVVNGQMIMIRDVIGYLDFVWDERRLVQRIVDTALIENGAREYHIEASDDAVAAELEHFRRRSGLYSIEKTHSWFERTGTSKGLLEGLLRTEVNRRLLATHVSKLTAEEFFATRARELDRALVARLGPVSRARAEGLVDELSRGRTSLLALIAREAVSDPWGKVRSPLVHLRRSDLEPEAARIVFEGAPGIRCPVPSGQGFDVVEVLEFFPALSLDERLRALILERQLEDWLADRRRLAKVQWGWGRVPTEEGTPSK